MMVIAMEKADLELDVWVREEKRGERETGTGREGRPYIGRRGRRQEGTVGSGRR